MRRIILLLAISVLAWGEGQLAPTVRCLDESDFGVTLEFVLEGEYAETISTQYGDFVRFHIPNGGFVGQVGAPEIPSFSTLVAVFGEKAPRSRSSRSSGIRWKTSISILCRTPSHRIISPTIRRHTGTEFIPKGWLMSARPPSCGISG